MRGPAACRRISRADAGKATPTESSITPIFEPSAANRTSQAHARRQPPATACPLIAATVGLGKAKSVASVSPSATMNHSAYAGSSSSIRRRSTPPENTLPAPVMTTDRTAGDAAQAASSWSNASRSSRSRGLAFPCTNSTTATPSLGSR